MRSLVISLVAGSVSQVAIVAATQVVPPAGGVFGAPFSVGRCEHGFLLAPPPTCSFDYPAFAIDLLATVAVLLALSWLSRSAAATAVAALVGIVVAYLAFYAPVRSPLGFWALALLVAALTAIAARLLGARRSAPRSEAAR